MFLFEGMLQRLKSYIPFISLYKIGMAGAEQTRRDLIRLHDQTLKAAYLFCFFVSSVVLIPPSGCVRLAKLQFSRQSYMAGGSSSS